ncbi:MAG: hypothetical protein Q9160_005180 [Pyrenula sp. 1 TL-2023]
MMLPLELLSIQKDLLFRQIQFRQLAGLLNPLTPPPQAIVVYGPEDTGKTAVVRGVLNGFEASHGVVDCTQCISLRHLLAKAYSSTLAALGRYVDWEQAGKCDNLNDLALKLKAILQERQTNFYLICDSIDRQREINAPFTAALVRLAQDIPHLCLVLIARSTRRLSLHAPGLPFIRFPTYTRDEAISLVVRKGPPTSNSDSSEEHSSRWYSLFVTAIYDSLIGPTTRSLRSLGEVCERLWPRFIQPHVDREKPPGRAKEWDFSKLLVRSRAIIQNEADQASDAHLLGDDAATEKQEISVPGNSTDGSAASTERPRSSPADAVKDQQNDAEITSARPLVLGYFSALVLVAAYLASHTSPKLDILLFSRLSSSSRKGKKSYHRRKLFQSSSKPGGAADNAISVSTSNSVAVLHKNFRRSFSLDRLISIVRATHPRGVQRRRGLADKVTSELAELVRLRLVNLMVGEWGADERLTVNVGKIWVEEVARPWNIDWKDFEI